MKFILILLLALPAFSQTAFNEIDPKREKELQRIEAAREEKRKRLEEEKIARESAKKAAAEKARLSKEKAEQDRIAKEKKKAEAEAYTKWLISERDRKMREGAQGEAQSAVTSGGSESGAGSAGGGAGKDSSPETKGGSKGAGLNGCADSVKDVRVKISAAMMSGNYKGEGECRYSGPLRPEKYDPSKIITGEKKECGSNPHHADVYLFKNGELYKTVECHCTIWFTCTDGELKVTDLTW